MKERVISGVIIAALIIGAGLLGGYPLAALIMVCAMIGYQELARAAGVLESDKKVNPLTGLSLGAAAVYYLGLMILQARWGNTPDQMVFASDFFTMVIIVAVFLGLMTIYVLTFPRFRSEQVMAAFFSFVYAPVLMSFVYRSRMLPYGIFMYALIFVCSSICDTCALAAGMLFGKHKIFPTALTGKDKLSFFYFASSLLSIFFLISIALSEYVFLGINPSYLFASGITLFFAKRFGAIYGGAVGFVTSFALSTPLSIGVMLMGLLILC
jgi:CDP-diglyceride synthetase